ncbi:hypothetical protein BK005_01925 [bacterium CG10_37_50]|uniref:Zinc-ribbon 15 domain-containing protein n=1 Tax=Candidatus Campbellbacteria bacterium CG22_combo_CG10-13_8_21_14_all_36_13 TaxID=1974529 RepID=A0A2H0DZQ1_9BACT|nr:MAG: hypothetical protein BK005_01925 [bacterium CG10_37_50]PIP87461.1 MAG: hypothetical protein COW81_00090 [Candidatus Campbellbacteria bacterium CG22_combo_CG10-13_8_21_14_all_36_13]
MIIFGWGHQKINNVGPTFKQQCSHCNNSEYWLLNKISTWFTLFFIPVFPYENKHFLSCPICQYGVELKSAQADEIKPFAEANQLLIDGKITENEYKTRLSLLPNRESEIVEAEVEQSIKSDDSPLTFCSNCGTGLTGEIKFCGNCGAKNMIE